MRPLSIQLKLALEKMIMKFLLDFDMNLLVYKVIASETMEEDIEVKVETSTLANATAILDNANSSQLHYLHWS